MAFSVADKKKKENFIKGPRNMDSIKRYDIYGARESGDGPYVYYQDHCSALARLMEKSMDGEAHDHLVDLKALAAQLAEDDDADRMHYADQFFEIIDKALVLLNPRESPNRSSP